jgi:hypothetical protein
MTALDNAPTGSRLGVAVGPDAAMCLDLVLDDVGVDYHRVRVTQGRGARVVIDLVDRADGYRVVDALRQHLGAELLEATIYHNGNRTRVSCSPAEPKLTAPSVELWRSPLH